MNNLKTVIISAVLTLDVDIPIDSTQQYIESLQNEAWDELSRALTHTDFIIEEVVIEDI